MNNVLTIFAMLFIAVVPSTTNYKLNNFSFGNGGSADSSTANYHLNATAGEQGGAQAATTNYSFGSGGNATQQANVPTISIDNPASYYNKLHFVIGTQNNPTDAVYAIAISSDNFVTTKYVKNDGTVGATLAAADFQTYAAFGGSGGSLVIGLASATTYAVKAKAARGKFTESGYGPVATAATTDPYISFSLSPNTLAIGNLVAGSVVNAPQPIALTFATNGESGGSIYSSGHNAGLKSLTAPFYKISAINGDLTATSEGYGAQITSAGQSTGGPLSKVAPFDVNGNNVAAMDATIRAMLSSAGPITGGSSSVLLMAKSASQTPAATDYSETLTIIASASF